MISSSALSKSDPADLPTVLSLVLLISTVTPPAPSGGRCQAGQAGYPCGVCVRIMPGASPTRRMACWRGASPSSACPSPPRCVYGVLARHAFQCTTANIGQRRIATLLSVHLGTVNRSLHELEERQHIATRGTGKGRRIYHLCCAVFGQKQRAGIEEVISSPSRTPRGWPA